MGKHWYDKTILEDGAVHLHRMSEAEMEERLNPPREDKPDDIVRIDYHCCGCGADFVQNIPLEKGDASMGEVYLHFEKCGKGVDWRPVKRHQVQK